MRPSQFPDKKLLDVIQWNEPEAGALACRYPMLDAEIQTGAWLAVRESEIALFVDEERGADIFGPGLYALNAGTLPVLARVKNWGKGSGAPFKADIYFFSMTEEFDQTWGTSKAIVVRDAEGDAIRVRGYGRYSYRVADVRTFFAQVSGARESYFVYDLDDRLRKTIAACFEELLMAGGILHRGMQANVAALVDTLADKIRPVFAALGLELTQFALEAISSQELPAVFDVAGTSPSAEEGNGCNCCGAFMRTDHGVLKCDYCHAVVAAEAGDDGLGASADHACPACEIPLLQATVGGASLLYCTRCDGMLVAMEEFDALVAAARALPGGLPVAAAQLRDPFDCPECKRAMGVSFYGEDVAVDSCEDCGLNWLDHGELARIAHAPVVGAAVVYFDAARGDSSVGLNLGV